MRSRLTNLDAATRTLSALCDRSRKLDLLHDLGGVLDHLNERGVKVILRTQPDTMSYLAQVSVSASPALIDIRPTSVSDRNPLVAVVYALHTAVGGTLDGGEYDDGASA